MVSAIKDREGSPPPRCAIITPGRIVHSRYREIASSSLIYRPTYFAEARFSDRGPQFKHQNGRTRHPIWQDMFELLSVLHLSDQDCELAVKLFAKSQTVIFSNHWNSNSINLDSVVVQQFQFDRTGSNKPFYLPSICWDLPPGSWYWWLLTILNIIVIVLFHKLRSKILSNRGGRFADLIFLYFWTLSMLSSVN